MPEPASTLCTIALMPSGRRGQVERGTNLLDAARALGVELESICGGRQTCGKCQIIVEEGQFPKHPITSGPDHLTPIDAREASSRAEHDLGERRLACAAEALGDLLITVPEESQARKQIIAKAATDRVIDVHPAVRQVYVEMEAATLEDTRGDWERLQQALDEQWEMHKTSIDLQALITLQPALRDKQARLKDGKLGVTVTVWEGVPSAKGQVSSATGQVSRDTWHLEPGTEVLRVQPGYAEGVCGLAVDIGSTTVAAHLCDLRTGAVLATESMMNPQVRYGEDLMSRVSYGMMEPQGVARMHRAIIRALNELVEKAVARAGVDRESILDAVLVGNPVMIHLLLGIDPVELGGAPFALAVKGPLDLKARDLGLELGAAAHVHVLPSIAGHVGADNVAVQLAEAPHLSDELMLVIDVGTNAEIVLGNRQGVLCASSPTGPAFEGAQITHGQRAAPGAIERVRIDPATLEPRFKVIGSEAWQESGEQGDRNGARGGGEQRSGAGGVEAVRSPPVGLAGQARGAGAKSEIENPGHPLGPEIQNPKATGICGSGIIEAVAEMFLAGIIDRDGRFAEGAAARSARVRFKGRTGEYVLADPELTGTGNEIVITQNDVRSIQLAKAALYAGAKLLMGEWERGDRNGARGAGEMGSGPAGVEASAGNPPTPPRAGHPQGRERSRGEGSTPRTVKVDRVVLAGAFGSYISPTHAMVLGMIPDCELGRVTAVGNAAGDGARIALLNREQRAEAARLARRVQHVQTAVAANFQDEFVAALAIPNARDPFPHLEGILPAQAEGVEVRRSRRRGVVGAREQGR